MKHFIKSTCLALALAMAMAFLTSCGGAASASSAPSATSDAVSATSGGTVDDATAQPTHEPGLFVDDSQVDPGDILTVDGTPVSFDLFRYYYLTYKTRLDSGDDSVWTGDSAEEMLGYLDNYVTMGVLSPYALANYADSLGVSLSADDEQLLEDRVTETKDSLGESYETALAEQYMTEAVYQQLLHDSLLYTRVLESQYSDAVMQNLQKNYAHVQHILIKYASEDSTSVTSTGEELPTREEALASANAALERAKSGEDFYALMQEYNTDTGEGEDGYTFTTGEMMEEFETAAFALSEGEISDIVEVKGWYNGFHIIKRLPISDTYLQDNDISSLMTEDMSTAFDNDIQAIIDKMDVQYGDKYELVAPDTMF